MKKENWRILKETTVKLQQFKIQYLQTVEPTKNEVATAVEWKKQDVETEAEEANKGRKEEVFI